MHLHLAPNNQAVPEGAAAGTGQREAVGSMPSAAAAQQQYYAAPQQYSSAFHSHGMAGGPTREHPFQRPAGQVGDE